MGYIYDKRLGLQLVTYVWARGREAGEIVITCIQINLACRGLATTLAIVPEEEFFKIYSNNKKGKVSTHRLGVLLHLFLRNAQKLFHIPWPSCWNPYIWKALAAAFGTCIRMPSLHYICKNMTFLLMESKDLLKLGIGVLCDLKRQKALYVF